MVGSLSEESDKRQKDEGGEIGDHGWTAGDRHEIGSAFWLQVFSARPSRTGSCC